MSEAPERIWAEDKTMPGDPARNGYWESRSASPWTEYIRADLHAAEVVALQEAYDEIREYVEKAEAEVACLTAERDAALKWAVQDAAKVPEIAALIEAASNASARMSYDVDLLWDQGNTSRHAATRASHSALSAALRAIAEAKP